MTVPLMPERNPSAHLGSEKSGSQPCAISSGAWVSQSAFEGRPDMVSLRLTWIKGAGEPLPTHDRQHQRLLAFSNALSYTSLKICASPRLA